MTLKKNPNCDNDKGGNEVATTKTKPSLTPMPADTVVYAHTENGREIREGKINGKTRYWVQPRNDNYWICCQTPEAALRAFYHPERYR